MGVWLGACFTALLPGPTSFLTLPQQVPELYPGDDVFALGEFTEH